ncbi:hypothetical protein DB30_07259 [Enhygromyxa salina]|uniref:Gram-negative bacterial tonB protein n=1 Tax=Enhygromyxa salina TaxID=215803 RepID=A0A0C2D1N0_9BACT|nr:AgmX/PglI C-terminal domain-containing protein [Enhygromyxa salina]KIG14072.1 hypothetical protein DB30_07259 [Enhygromyxa salina]
MTTRTWITAACTLALLCTVGCKKEETTTPDDATAGDDDEDDAPEPAPAEVEDEAPQILSKASFDETITDHFSDVSDCYVAALEGNPDLKGKLNAEFTFGADGVPTSVTAVDGSSISDEALVQCISDAAANWGFDQPAEAGMRLRYEFNLAPAG